MSDYKFVIALVILGDTFFHAFYVAKLVISSKSCKFAVSIYLLHERREKESFSWDERGDRQFVYLLDATGTRIRGGRTYHACLGER